MSCIGNYEGIRRYLSYTSESNSSKPRPKRYVNLEEIPEFKEGDWAFSLVGGWGKIVLIDNLSYPIILKCTEDREYGHRKDGKYCGEYMNRFLFTVSEAKLLFNLEPPKEKDELDIMLEKAIEFYGTDVLKKGIKLLGRSGCVYTLESDIDFKDKSKFFINAAKQLAAYNDLEVIARLKDPYGEFRPIVLGYSNDKEPKPLVKGTKCTAVTPGGYTRGVIFPFEITICKFFISNEEAGEYAKTLRKVQVEITEAEYEMIKNARNDSKTL